MSVAEYFIGDVFDVLATIPADKWAATVTDTPPVELTPGELALAFDVSRDGAWSTIAVAAGTVRSSYVEVITWRNGVVLDPFAGSGTTLAVATGHGRDAIGIDLDARNAELARERIGMFLTVTDTTEVVA